MCQSPDARTYAAFAGTVLIGGSNFIAVSFSNRELPPLFGATVRFALATLLFLLIAQAWRVPLARGRAAAGPALYGALGVGTGYALLYYALISLTAGTTAVILATVPLFTLVMAVALRQERLSAPGIAGAVLAVVGIAILSRGALGGDAGWAYFAAAVGGAVAIAASSVVARSCRNVHPVNMNAIGMATGAMLLAVGSLILRERWALPRGLEAIAAVGYLTTLGSIGLFQIFLYVVNWWTTSATVYAIATMPVVTVVLGAAMLGEPITPEVLVGGAIVMAAVYVDAVHGPGSPSRVRTAEQTSQDVEASGGRR
ncbi:MAG: EamA family transporter [Armatimonadota bacterium]|nr:EamA family transporter [Armatimonadota bacterium]MDR7454735.1 EamA family transporter [Armatimonadota bacterium]MDR7498053.1 EamA family transporter [Armatimonadota bacterium]